MDASDDQGGQEGQQVQVRVFAPRTPDPKEFSWAKTLKVGEAAKIAAVAFGYSGNNAELQLLGDSPRVLDPHKTLVAEDIKSGDELEVSTTGGGV